MVDPQGVGVTGPCGRAATGPAAESRLGTPSRFTYGADVMGFLKFVGMVNAAIWLGAVVSFTFVTGPAFFSDEMKGLFLQDAGQAIFGSMAMVVVARYFILQHVCGLIALLHAIAGWLYLGRPLKTLTNYVLVSVFTIGLMGGFWFQPRIRNLHAQKYSASSTATQKAAASRSLAIHHGVARTLDLIALAGLVVYFWRVAHPNDPARFASLNKFRS